MACSKQCNNNESIFTSAGNLVKLVGTGEMAELTIDSGQAEIIKILALVQVW